MGRQAEGEFAMDRIAMAAAALTAAEREGPIAALPEGAVPADEAAAYAVQDAVLGDDALSGWKATPTAPHIGAPIGAGRLLADGAALPPMIAPEVEVEIAVIIARDLPPRTAPYTRDEVLAALGGIRAAFEIIRSRYADRRAMPKLATLADAMSHGAFGLGTGKGAGAADWIGLDLGRMPAVLWRGGAEIARATTGPTTDETVSELVWLANHASERGRGLRAGQAVITGARVGPMPLPGPGRYVALIEGLGEVAFTL